MSIPGFCKGYLVIDMHTHTHANRQTHTHTKKNTHTHTCSCTKVLFLMKYYTIKLKIHFSMFFMFYYPLKPPILNLKKYGLSTIRIEVKKLKILSEIFRFFLARITQCLFIKLLSTIFCCLETKIQNCVL